MKKLLLFTVSLVFAGMVNAQDCTPQINYGTATLGLNPNPPVGSVQGVPYDEVNTMVLPHAVDNTLTPAVGDSINLCAIGINGVIGMPPGYSYDVWAFHTISPTSNYDVLAQTTDTIHIFQPTAITRICIRFKNPNPPASSIPVGTDGLADRDTAIIQIIVGAWADIFGCAEVGSDTVEVHLAIKDAIYAGIDDEASNSFAVNSNNPNPANDITYLNFTTPKEGDVTITLFDAVGRNVRNIKLGANPGANNYALSTSELKSGIYIYNISFNGKTISKKLIVNR